ncbi:MAG TPA: hypothetical protein VFB96_18275 [Pirellulaceae bacterium]|nr:hypothetical protein [Pirellulaceae bacterium]
MEARLAKAALLAAALLSCGANWRSENFIIVSAPSDELAKEVATNAEKYRRELAIQWLGRELPKWRDPCPIAAYIGPREPSRGETTFIPTGGVPYGWQMKIYGTRERVLDSVLPHEVLHTVFATHFGVPLPRWADEGACTTVEHASERAKQEGNLVVYLKTNRGIAFSDMFRMKEYPPDMLPLYAQGYSLARFLIAHGGERKFVDYIGDGLNGRSWTKATQQHYGFESLADLQTKWLEWVKQGSPPISRHAEPTPQELADSDPKSIKSQVARLRGGDALTSDRRPEPAPPSAFDRQPAPEKTSVARPESSGWYKRQKQRTSETDERAAAGGGAVIRGQEPESIVPPPPPPEYQGNATQPQSAPSGRLVPIRRPIRPERTVAAAAAPSRQVLMEWTRPKDQPWDGTAPKVEVALRSEPRQASPSSTRQVEYFDAPLAREGTTWR